MARLYADEHFPEKVVYALRLLGHDVLTVKQTNLDKRGDAVPDDLVLAFARRQRRAVLTYNRDDFLRLHRENPGHYGIIACASYKCSPAREAKAKAKRIDAEIKRVRSLNGQFLWISKPRSR
jgi:hypothetical protein